MTPRFFAPCLLLTALAALACEGSDNEPDPPGAQAGAGNRAGSAGQGGGAQGGGSGSFAPPADPGPGGVVVTISGETLGFLGYDFLAGQSKSTDPAFVDGWSIRFSHVILTVGAARFHQDPDKNSGDPTDLGAEVARSEGPWAVDLARPGQAIDKGSGQPGAHALFALPASGFDPKSRYAFSYDLIAAAAQAARVNLDAEGEALYQQAISHGWTVLFQGQATYAGPAPEAGSVFAKLPHEVAFRLGLAGAASYINCQNPDLPSGGDESPRGVQTAGNQSTAVQITFHTDHVFWDALNVEGTPLHFDPIAARSSGSADMPGVVDATDLIDADFTAFTTRDGVPLPARSLVSDYTPPTGQLGYQTHGAGPFTKNSFAAYLAYAALGGGHMNADGECEIRLK